MKTRTLFLVACVAVLASCTPAGPAAKPVTEVTLSETETTILIDEEKTLTATVLPSDATDKTVSWTSSDDGIATVNGGIVRGIAEGTATITASAGGISASCKINVKRPAIVITGDVAGITYSSATVSYRILFKYVPAGAKLEEAGILYGKSPNLVIGTDLFYGIPRGKDENPDMSGSYTAEPYNLDEQTTYYYQAYARFDGVDYFGEVRSFVTRKLDIATDKLVDMGLSVKWAGWKVGCSPALTESQSSW